ncbi:hypothetical protein SDC9_73825 [bioreactor metagenome]|uniref:Uncharacterized protein n=1 Tax=bioreactor metagenome TaxID=1076179 RepID=A0A644YFF5_9ZZZZ
MVDEAVLEGLLRGEPPVAVGVRLDLLQRLAGVLGDELGHLLLRGQQLLGVDLDLGGGATDGTQWLVHQDPAVRQGVALAAAAGAEQELSHRGGHAHGHRGDVVRDPLHGVVDRHACGHRAARGVDVEVDVLLRVLGVQQEHLGADRVRVLVLDLRTQEDDPVRQEGLVDIVRHAEWARAVGGEGASLIHVHDPEPTGPP